MLSQIRPPVVDSIGPSRPMPMLDNLHSASAPRENLEDILADIADDVALHYGWLQSAIT